MYYIVNDTEEETPTLKLELYSFEINLQMQINTDIICIVSINQNHCF